MFERFDESARMVVVTAQEEARALRHTAIGGEHLLLGIAKEAPVLLNGGQGAVREQVIALAGVGQTASSEWMSFTDAARRALDLAGEEAVYRGQDTVRPAHILLVLLREDEQVRSVVEALGQPLDEVGRRAAAACERASSREPTDIHQALREGYPVAVTLGEGLPVGDLGNARADARVLLAMLVADGQVASMLRDHGVDEDAVRRFAPGAC
jgi:ATP-dependent Clp protease ATP-binding subunit ClpA